MFNFSKKSKGKASEQTKAMNLADKYFSRYIRLKHSFSAGGNDSVLVCKCITCGSIKSITNIDCGHFVNRGNHTVRFDEDNARPQCKRCNRYRSGEHTQFEAALIKELGEDRVNEIKSLGLQAGESNIYFYKEKADEFRKKFNELVKQRGILNPWRQGS